MNKLILGSIAALNMALSPFSMAHTAVAPTPPKASPATKKHTTLRYLYVVHSKEARIIKNKQHYQVDMKKPIITYFTDRPFRRAGRISHQKFLYLWGHMNNSFTQSNPNAYIAGVNLFGDDVDMNDVVELSAPTYQNDHLAFTIQTLPDDAKHIQLGKIDDAVIFVDDAACSLGNIGPDCP
jgi:hypothetical protein